MKRHMLLVLVAGLLTGADKADRKTTSDKESLQGTWQAVSMESQGEKRDDTHKYELIFQGGDFPILKDGESFIQGTFKVNPKNDPKTLDFSITKGEGTGKTAPGIYQMKGDQLKWCSNEPGSTERPKSFGTKGTKFMTVTFKRKKT